MEVDICLNALGKGMLGIPLGRNVVTVIILKYINKQIRFVGTKRLIKIFIT